MYLYHAPVALIAGRQARDGRLHVHIHIHTLTRSEPGNQQPHARDVVVVDAPTVPTGIFGRQLGEIGAGPVSSRRVGDP
jgi:hypothetical protein